MFVVAVVVEVGVGFDCGTVADGIVVAGTFERINWVGAAVPISEMTSI